MTISLENTGPDGWRGRRRGSTGSSANDPNPRNLMDYTLEKVEAIA